ncbi:hypothetical protein [Hyphomicrobium sp.]|uniref:hypothetical protein n=1 Tax=Hyphomicrobium sp. TaxID=82 RepID=UPI000FB85E80|nr:hypothetical protein [Hyphomicrobium sp.]RUP09237.1 MAG: hypothetical protein EKK38_11500 [Hyphomicrobium sp.]
MKTTFAIAGLATMLAHGAQAGELYIVSRCAPISLLTGFIAEDPFAPSSPIFVDGKRLGELRVCDALRTSVPPGKHNVRVKLAGKSDYGISSDAGMDVIAGTAPIYIVMYSNSFTGADAVDPQSGRQFLSDVRTARGK